MQNDFDKDDIDFEGLWGVMVRVMIVICIVAVVWTACGCASWKSVLIDEAQRYAPLMIESLQPGAEGYEGEASLIICAGNQCAEASCYGRVSNSISSIQCRREGPYPKNEIKKGGASGDELSLENGY